MIYTLTASPSLDLIMSLPGRLRSGGIYRALSEEIRPGGRGVNISIMLRHLGVGSTALGFVAGFSGDELMRLTAAAGISTGFIRVRRGRTRVNLRLRDGTDAVTRVNGLGPVVTDADASYLTRRLNSLGAGDFLILTGAIPPSMPRDLYAACLRQVRDRGISVVLDCEPELWEQALPHGPWLFKVNLGNLAAYCGREPDSPAAVTAAASGLLEAGAENVLISLGQEGAVLVRRSDPPLRVRSPRAAVVDEIGADDSLIAGFVADYAAGHDIQSALLNAVAARAATAGTVGLGSSVQVRNVKELILSEYGPESG